jgi:hypothetical protein
MRECLKDENRIDREDADFDRSPQQLSAKRVFDILQY